MGLDPASVGRYRILGELGRGAMGVVYLAEDPLLKRGVAVKVIASDRMLPEEALARFRREAEMAARLHHPAIVTVFDVGEAPGIGPFLAMEFVEGTSLQEHLNQGPLPLEQAVDLFRQALAALQAAHDAGVIHRDIKPGNFMLTRDGKLKLMDFGLALGSGASNTALMGTPSYAAPELLGGAPPSPQTDAWALAVMGWRMLSGQLPFDGPTVAAVLSAIHQTDPDLSAPVPEPLKTVFRRALAKDPAQRYATLARFQEDLDQALLAEPRENTPGAPMWRHPQFLVGGTATLVLLGGMLWWVLESRETRKLTVMSQPSGARVTLDGTPIGETPLRQAAAQARARALVIEKNGFRPFHTTLGKGDQSLSVTLEPSPIIVDVISEPPGAEILVNGKSRGNSPMTGLELPGRGRHELTLRLEGYEPWSMVLNQDRRPPAVIKLVRIEASRQRKNSRTLAERVKGWFK